MNENEIERIAAAVSALRPDWPISSLRTLLTKPELAKRPRRDVAVALAWVACESASKTPARVLEAGPWWKATVTEGGTLAPRPPRKEEACATCGRRENDHRGILADHPFKPLTHAARGRTTAAALARAELAQAKANQCTHGIDRRRGACGECGAAAAKSTETETKTSETKES